MAERVCLWSSIVELNTHSGAVTVLYQNEDQLMGAAKGAAVDFTTQTLLFADSILHWIGRLSLDL
jgi:hypothetical protein